MLGIWGKDRGETACGLRPAWHSGLMVLLRAAATALGAGDLDRRWEVAPAGLLCCWNYLSL